MPKSRQKRRWFAPWRLKLWDEISEPEGKASEPDQSRDVKPITKAGRPEEKSGAGTEPAAPTNDQADETSRDKNQTKESREFLQPKPDSLRAWQAYFTKPRSELLASRQAVMVGLVPAIHVFAVGVAERRGRPAYQSV